MPRQCPICYSPYRDLYEKLRLRDKWTVKDIYRAALDKGERFSYDALCRHFRNHVDAIVKARTRADKLRRDIIKEEVKKDIKIATTLRQNLETLAKQLDMTSKNMNDEKARKETRAIIYNINSTIELLLRFSDKIRPELKETEEDIYDRVL